MQSHELHSEAASPPATRPPRGSATLAPGRTVSHLRFPAAPGTQPRPLRLRGRTGMRLAGPAPGLPGRETDSARTEWVPEEARGCPGGTSSAGTPRARGTPAPALGGAAPAGRGRGRAGRRGGSPPATAPWQPPGRAAEAGTGSGVSARRRPARQGPSSGQPGIRGPVRAVRAPGGAQPPHPGRGAARTCPDPPQPAAASPTWRLRAPPARRSATPRPRPRQRGRADAGDPARRRARTCCAACHGCPAGAASAPRQHGGRGLRRKPGGGEAAPAGSGRPSRGGPAPHPREPAVGRWGRLLTSGPARPGPRLVPAPRSPGGLHARTAARPVRSGTALAPPPRGDMLVGWCASCRRTPGLGRAGRPAGAGSPLPHGPPCCSGGAAPGNVLPPWGARPLPPWLGVLPASGPSQGPPDPPQGPRTRPWDPGPAPGTPGRLTVPRGHAPAPPTRLHHTHKRPR